MFLFLIVNVWPEHNKRIKCNTMLFPRVIYINKQNIVTHSVIFCIVHKIFYCQYLI